MPYVSYPKWCSICKKEIRGGMGVASHERGKQHKENVAKLSPKLTGEQEGR